MIMETLLATHVRANMGEFIDTVVREKPQAVRRNRDVIVATSREQMKLFLSVYELNFEYEQDEDGRFAGSMEEVDVIVADGESLEELKLELAHQLVEYAKDYFAEYSRYTAAPNTRIHAPYIFRVLLEDDVESVARLLHG
jgi:predicted RNase H-like HicB family nuclease